LRERGGSLRPKELYDLTLLATGDTEKADEAALARIEQDLREDKQVVTGWEDED
jgi:hypothetical protein